MMPKNFPGLTEFMAEADIPPGYAAHVQSLWFIGRVVDAASQIPTAPTPETAEAHFEQMDFAERALEAAAETVRHVRAWSRKNLEPEHEPKHKAEPEHEAKHKAEPEHHKAAKR
jgi:hypothetical protein